ncbi:MAG: hypothetical protein IKU93_02730 [Alistipes sp.]|nr:hypothetical protein [Alistipes sp.]
MELNLKIGKTGINTTPEVITEEYTLNYGHIFRGTNGRDGVDGKSAYDYAKEAGYDKSESEFAADLREVGNKASQEALMFVEGDVADLKELIVEKVDKVEGKDLSDNNYTDADKALVQKIPSIESELNNKVNVDKLAGYVDRGEYDEHLFEMEKALDTKQDSITITTKANGNIVLLGKEFMPATPSGDPMHYMYEAVGAVWNATTGFWQMYDMVDVTKEEMKKAFLLGRFNPNDAQPLNASVEQHPAWVRFNIPRNGSFALYTSGGSSFAQSNKCLEFINLTFTSQISTSWLVANSQFVNAANAFNGCSNLRRICGPLEMSLTTNTTNMFAGCTKLTTVDVKALKQSISFADSPLLSKESILLMIENSNATSAITITLHSTAYAMAMADADIKLALNSKTLVKLASA